MLPFQPSEDFVVLVRYFGTQSPGEELAWESIEANTGVVMDARGKEMVRRAVMKSHPGWAPIRGWGIRLASAEEAKSETGRRLRYTANAFHRSGRYAERSLGAFSEQLGHHDRQALQLVAAGAKTLKLFTRNKLKKALEAPSGTSPTLRPLCPMLPEAWVGGEKDMERRG